MRMELRYVGGRMGGGDGETGSEMDGWRNGKLYQLVEWGGKLGGEWNYSASQLEWGQGGGKGKGK